MVLFLAVMVKGAAAAAVVEGANPGLQSCPYMGLDGIGLHWTALAIGGLGG